MEGLPSGDIQSKYHKLATEYSKLRGHAKVLKKGVLDEQALTSELKETLKEKEKSLRKSELEIDSLIFRNQQLTKRVSVLQEELEILQLKLTKKLKGKQDDKNTASSSSSSQLDAALLLEELQKKIMENAQYASQLSDSQFEVAQLRTSMEDYQKIINESDSRNKCEIAKLKNKIQDLQFSLDAVTKDRNNGTSSRLASQPPSCNGDFTSEAGSLIGSEDALSATDDLHDHVSGKANIINEQDNQKLRMECELLRMENESLRLDLGRTTSREGRGHDSGDFGGFAEVSVEPGGRSVGLLGSLQAPLELSEEIHAREQRITTYFTNKLSEVNAEKQTLDSKTEHYMKECELLRLRLEAMDQDKQTNEQIIDDKQNIVFRLEEEMQSTSSNYEEKMSALTEHLAALNEQITRQYDVIQFLKHSKKKSK